MDLVDSHTPAPKIKDEIINFRWSWERWGKARKIERGPYEQKIEGFKESLERGKQTIGEMKMEEKGRANEKSIGT